MRVYMRHFSYSDGRIAIKGGYELNILAQLCGLVLLLIIIFFYRRQRRIRLKTGDAFLFALCVTLLSVTLDVLSIVFIENMEVLPMWATETVCKSYLVTLVGLGFCALRYVQVDIYEEQRIGYRKRRMGYSLVAIAGGCLIYALPIHYFRNDAQRVVYTYGPSVLTTYLFAVFFVIITLSATVYYRKRMNPRRREAVMLWMFFWLLASVIQFFNNRLLLVGYSSAIGIMLVYLLLENPEMNLDRRTGLLNQSALVQYLRQLYSRNQTFSVVVFVLEHSFQKSLSVEEEQELKLEIAHFLQTVPSAVVFKRDEDETVLLFDGQEDATEAIQLIQERMSLGWGEAGDIFVPSRWMYISDSTLADGDSELLYLIRYVRQNSKKFQENGSLCVDRELVEGMKRKKQVEMLIYDAMEQDRVEVFYQPIYSTQEKKFTAAEALVRIRDEQGNLISPAEFVDVAEKNGMILRLGEIIFEQVCCFLRNHDLRKYGLHYIEVNLSMEQCAYASLAEQYISIMKKYRVSPEMINLEITESASMRAKRTLQKNMKTLMDYGVRFSLDDFGTGQSNLNYIIDMPVDIVKFDRMMSMAYFENGKGKYVMDAAMHMIHGMKLEIVSEGIETEEQYLEMERLGISYIQGFYFSKPLPSEAFLTFLREKQLTDDVF